MKEMEPTRETLERTVERLTARFQSLPEAAPLMRALSALEPRFISDLPDQRDLALARAAALMVVRAVIEDWNGSGLSN